MSNNLPHGSIYTGFNFLCKHFRKAGLSCALLIILKHTFTLYQKEQTQLSPSQLLPASHESSFFHGIEFTSFSPSSQNKQKSWLKHMARVQAPFTASVFYVWSLHRSPLHGISLLAQTAMSIKHRAKKINLKKVLAGSSESTFFWIINSKVQATWSMTVMNQFILPNT